MLLLTEETAFSSSSSMLDGFLTSAGGSAGLAPELLASWRTEVVLLAEVPASAGTTAGLAPKLLASWRTEVVLVEG